LKNSNWKAPAVFKDALKTDRGFVSLPALTPIPAIVIGGKEFPASHAPSLSRPGFPVRVLDAGVRPAALSRRRRKMDFASSSARRAFLSTEPLLNLIDALGLKMNCCTRTRAPRDTFSSRPVGPGAARAPSLLTTPLLDARTKWRYPRKCFGRTNPPSTDESIAAFVRRKFGDELLDRLVAPFVSGHLCSDPEKLSLRASFPKLHESR